MRLVGTTAQFEGNEGISTKTIDKEGADDVGTFKVTERDDDNE